MYDILTVKLFDEEFDGLCFFFFYICENMNICLYLKEVRISPPIKNNGVRHDFIPQLEARAN